MTDHPKGPDARHIAKRYASEKRFRAYGLCALLLATAFLLLLLTDIIGRSIPAFTQYHAVATLMVDPAKVDATKVAAGDFDGLANDAWRGLFPGLTSRGDRRALNKLLSNGGGDDLRRLVVSDPTLIGKEVTVPLLLSDDADLHLKGLSTEVGRTDGKGELTLRSEAESIFLSGDGLVPGSIVLANGGAFKISKDGAGSAVEILHAPSAVASAPQGKWQLVILKTPEANRKMGDKETIWLELLKDKGAVERQFAWNLFLNGDSREAELSGILGSVVGSLMVVLITILIALPIGVAAAIYLEEFAPKNRFTDLIEVNVNNLAAVPSIIFGLLGLAVFLGMFGMPRSAPLVGGIVIALMSLPTIIIASRAAVRAVPPSIREAALGVGASHQQAVFHHVIPLAMPGIMTGTILAVASAIGETAPLILIGMVAFVVDIPGSFLESATVLPVQIYLWSDLPEKAFEARTAAAIVVLLVIMMCLNAFAIYLRKRFERRW